MAATFADESVVNGPKILRPQFGQNTDVNSARNISVNHRLLNDGGSALKPRNRSCPDRAADLRSNNEIFAEKFDVTELAFEDDLIGIGFQDDLVEDGDFFTFEQKAKRKTLVGHFADQ